ncbi:YycH family regulatory protein [Tepidibacillus fermentans]|uniref:Regulatory protein YycH of two-component signal transduction system YycFG n=1 Tax=Tepidibacillus fermentans TaxID=1281767 RepID=A0A4R3KC44_9BACI|nr:two-component system activity regulator YycH [Tepidibacillus fermentans]TCS80784.1 regulatory protein YycH of two-component signal transduction system YycFG [Tepidibacillus fermentans]
MREKVKSIILFLLVINSLILTWILIYYSPNNGNTQISEFLPRARFGQKLSTEKVLGFERMILHFGNNRHTVLYPGSNLFQKLLQEIKNESFYDFVLQQQPIEWKEIIENQKGIELILPVSMPKAFLKNILMISPITEIPDQVNRIWIINHSQTMPIVYFINDHEDKVYAAKTSITSTKLDDLLNSDLHLPLYSYLISNQPNKKIVSFYYLPEEEVEIQVPRRSMVQITDDHLIQLLFLDHTAVRKVYDQNGGQRMIYTDGSSSLQVYAKEHYLNYFQSISNGQKNLDLEKDLKTAINYINQHGGFGGSYFLTSSQILGKNLWEFEFNQYFNGIPVTDKELFQYRLQMNNGSIIFFERPTLMFIENLEPLKVKIIPRPAIMEELKKNGIKNGDILAIELTYHLVQKQDHVEFYPYWSVRLKDQPKLEVPAFQSGVL